MRSEILFLRDIVEAIELVETFLLGYDSQTFKQDEKTKAAVLQKLALIGEAARHLRDPLGQRYPQVDWNKAAALRNLISHAYFSIDYDIVYRTARHSLPLLKQQVQAILNTEDPPKRA